MSTDLKTDYENIIVICRTCCKECDDFKSLFKFGEINKEHTTLATMLNYFSGIDFVPEDTFLPSTVCLECVQNIAGCYLFTKKVKESDQYWRNVVVFDEIREEEAEENVEEHIEEGEQHIVEEVHEEEAHGLQDLATVAQIKEAFDNIEYITMQIVQESEEEEEDEKVLTIYADEGTEEEVVFADAEEEVIVHEITDTQTAEAFQEVIDDIASKKEIENECSEIEALDDVEENIKVDDPASVDTIDKAQQKTIKDVKKTSNTKGMKRVKVVKTRTKKSVNANPDPDLKCKICGRQLSNPNSFKYHMQLHSDVSPFLCSLCGERFKTRNAYDGHLATHDPNNPNTCEVCGKIYRQSSSLRTHMLTHTGEKPFQCDICGKGMTQKSGYKKHLLTHTGEKPHRCDICGREFRYSSNMLAHRRSHSGERPFKCGQCGKRFPTREQTKRHALVHSVDRPYICELCNKSFKRRLSLLTHRATHETAPQRLEQKVSKSNIVEMY